MIVIIIVSLMNDEGLGIKISWLMWEILGIMLMVVMNCWFLKLNIVIGFGEVFGDLML